MNLPPALTRPIFGIPTWVVGIVVIGAGVGLYFVIKGRQGGPGNTLGQSSSPAPDTSQIDPYTGVPYSIEGSTNPATGLPAYYGGPGIDPTPTPTPTQTPTPAANNYTSTGRFRVDQIALSYRVPGGWQALESANPQLQGKPASYIPPSGQLVALPGGSSTLPQGNSTGSGGTGSGPNTPFQATPYWPIMTDVIAAGALS